MVLTWYGGRCLVAEDRIRGADARSVVFFPHTKTSRVRTLEERANIIVADEGDALEGGKAFRVDTAGEYDVAGFRFRGLVLEDGATPVYVLEAQDVTVCHVGTGVSGSLKEKTLEAIGAVDVVVAPLPFRRGAADIAAGLSEFVRTIEARIVVPLVADAKARAAVQRELGIEGETVEKLTVAAKDIPQEGFRLVFLQEK